MKTGGNLKGAVILRHPSDLDPASAQAAVEKGEEFGFRVRDLIDRGHRPRHAIVIALKNSGVYEIIRAREGAMERIFAYFEREVSRLNQKMDEGAKIVRGVPIVVKGGAEMKILGPDGLPLEKSSGE